jgi:hypothetical protein
MRNVQERGGPCPGYQSEVENGKKGEVSSAQLLPWTQALGITVAFARGELPRYRTDPARCRGLAGEIASLVSGPSLRADLVTLPPMERARRVLRLMADRVASLPPVVLTWVLGIQVRQLQEMMYGDVDIDRYHLTMIVELTTLPRTFFLTEVQESATDAILTERYLPVIRLADQMGMSPETLEALIRRGYELPPARTVGPQPSR